jgi:hypothetical protein
MRHALFEACLTQNNFTRQFVQKHTPRIVRDHAEQLIGCGIYSERETITEVMRIQPQLQRFAHAYTDFGMEQHQHQDGAHLDGHGMSPEVKFLAKTVQDTEEGTVSTELGLKGFVDVTVEATTKSGPVQRTINGNEQPTPPQTALMGIELKTGHNQTPYMSHVAQLSLYTLTLRTRHGTTNRFDKKGCNYTNSFGSNGASNGGMLLYLNHENFKAVHVSPAMNEIKSLLSQRNMIATEMKRAAKPRGITIEYENDRNKEQKLDKQPKQMYVL